MVGALICRKIRVMFDLSYDMFNVHVVTYICSISRKNDFSFSEEYLRNETFRRENNITEEFLDEYMRMDHVYTLLKKIKSKYMP